MKLSEGCGVRALASVVLLTALLAAQEVTPPAARFARGERLRYQMDLKVDSETRMAPLGGEFSDAEPKRLAFTLNWTLEAMVVQSDGSVRLRATIERFAVESSRPLATLNPAQYEGRAVSYTLRADGSVTNVEMPEEWLEEGKLPAWLDTWLTQSSSSGALPPGAQPGDRWSAERTLTVPALPPLRLKTESSYLQDESFRGVACAAVLTRLSLENAAPGRETLAAGTTVRSQVRGYGHSINCYALSNGRLLDSMQTSQEDILMEIERVQVGQRPLRLLLRAHMTTESYLRVTE